MEVAILPAVASAAAQTACLVGVIEPKALSDGSIFTLPAPWAVGTLHALRTCSDALSLSASVDLGRLASEAAHHARRTVLEARTSVLSKVTSRAAHLLPAVGLFLAAKRVMFNAAVSSRGAFWRCLQAYAAVELAFQGVQQWRYADCNASPADAPDVDRVPSIMERMCQLAGVMDIREFLSGWFCGAPFEAIRRDNVAEFVTGALYCCTPQQLSHRQQAAAAAFIGRMETAWNIRFQPGLNAAVRPMMHLWEPLRVLPMPLFVYLASEACAMVTRVLLHRKGYARATAAGFTFWVRHPKVDSTASGVTAAGGGCSNISCSGSVEPPSHGPAQHAQRAQRSNRCSAPQRHDSASSCCGGSPPAAACSEEAGRSSRADSDCAGTEAQPRRATDGEACFACTAAAVRIQSSGGAAVATALAAGRNVIWCGPGEALEDKVASPSAAAPAAANTAAAGTSAAAVTSAAAAATDAVAAATQAAAAATPETSSASGAAAGVAAPAAAGTQAAAATQAGAVEAPDVAAEAARPAAAAHGRPLVFIHGVGWGLMPYLGFVSEMAAAAPESPVILVEAPHISLRLSAKPFSVDALAHAVATEVQRLGFSEACFVGHSYGTFAVSRLRQLYPEMVASMALLDPVCCMTCSPQLLANFIYRPAAPPPLLRLPTGLEVLDWGRFACARDMVLAASFCRGFYWHELMLWPEDMPAGATSLVLSSHDTLVPVSLIKAQMEAAGSSTRILEHTTGGHGGFLFDAAFRAQVVAEVQQLLVVST